MLSKLKIIVGLGIMLTAFGSNLSYALTTVYETVTEEQLARGLVYEHKSKLTSNGWVDIHVLKMDLTEESIKMDVVRDQYLFGKRDQLTDFVNQDEHLVGAINGSFFNMGTDQSDIEGFEYRSGKISFAKDDYNLYKLRGASMFVYEDANPVFKFISTDISFVTSSGTSVYVVGINTTGDLKNPIIFNNNAYQSTESIEALAPMYKVVVIEDIISDIVEPGVVVDIPANGYVMTIHEDQSALIINKLYIGQSVTLKTTTNFDIENLELAVTGGGMILEEGVISKDGLIVGVNARHPRTAIGVTEDHKTLIAMVVDGRGQSIGATHEELAEYLLEYDVYNAMHFDGGGSSTMTSKALGEFEATTDNTPSDGSERPVVNGLGFVTTAEATSEFKLQLKVNQVRSFVNSKIKLDLKAYDLNFNPVMVDESQIAWSIAGGEGVMEETTFIPKEAGQVVLTAYYKGEESSITLDIVDTLIDIQIVPKVINYEDGQQTLTVIGTDSEGYQSVIDNNLLEWKLDEAIGTIVDGVFIGRSPGPTTKIEVSYKEVKEYAYVVSGVETESIMNLNTMEVETMLYPETVEGMASIVTLENEEVLQLAYTFEKSDVAQAVYGVLEGITIDTAIDQLEIKTESYDHDIYVKAHMTDSNEEEYTVTFENGIANLPSSMAYPIKVSRLYVVSIVTSEKKTGTIIIKDLIAIRKAQAEDITNLRENLPVDVLYELLPDKGYEVSIFGATKGRNRLLDEIVLGKVYDVFNSSDYAVYAGASDIDSNKIDSDYMVYQNQFEVVDLEPARIITLGMGSGSMVKTDMTQWDRLNSALSTTVQNTLIIVGTERLRANTDEGFVNEGELIHEVLRDFSKKSGKTIFYVNASGYAYNLDYYEGIRYIDLNGLWYRVEEDNSVDLYDSFQDLKFTFTDDEVTYRVLDLYPKTVVNE